MRYEQLQLLTTVGCRRVTIVSDSLLVTDIDTLLAGINNEESWVWTQYIHGGTTSFTNDILREIYSVGVVEAFSYPDATVMSFGTNEAVWIYNGDVDYNSAFESFWRLAHQAVEAGSRCIVLFEGSHLIGEFGNTFGDNTNITLTNWFYDMHQMEGEREYLGYKYKFVIADISQLIVDDRQKYISDYVHLTNTGTVEAAKAIKAALDTCPDGRWNFYDPDVGHYEYADGEGPADAPWYSR